MDEQGQPGDDGAEATQPAAATEPAGSAGRSGSRGHVLKLAGAMVAISSVATAFLWIATSTAARDSLTDTMRPQVVDLAEAFRPTPDGTPPPAPTPEALRAALDCTLAGTSRSGPACERVEHHELAVVADDGSVTSAAHGSERLPPVPTRTSDVVEQPDGSLELPVTAVRDDDHTTLYVLLADNPAYLAMQRRTPAELPFLLFVVVGSAAIAAQLVVIIPLVRRREQLLQQRGSAVAGLIHSKADALREANAAARLRSDFLTSVSHRFRTPLQVIQGMADTLAARASMLSPEQVEVLATQLQRNAKGLDEMLVDLLDVDRLLRGTLEPSRRSLDMVALVDRVVDQMGAEVVRNKASGQQVMGEVDAAQVERIVEQVLENAIEHTPPGEQVEVEVVREESAVLVRVLDRGPGIPEEARRKVFDPLYRIEDNHPDPGLGIGMTFVQRLTAAHGGRVWTEPREGGGTIVSVRLPDEGRDGGVDLWQLTANMGA